MNSPSTSPVIFNNMILNNSDQLYEIAQEDVRYLKPFVQQSSALIFELNNHWDTKTIEQKKEFCTRVFVDLKYPSDLKKRVQLIDTLRRSDGGVINYSDSQQCPIKPTENIGPGLAISDPINIVPKFVMEHSVSVAEEVFRNNRHPISKTCQSINVVAQTLPLKDDLFDFDEDYVKVTLELDRSPPEAQAEADIELDEEVPAKPIPDEFAELQTEAQAEVAIELDEEVSSTTISDDDLFALDDEF